MELERSGILKPLPAELRFQKANGAWRVVFERGPNATSNDLLGPVLDLEPVAEPPEPSPAPVEVMLVLEIPDQLTRLLVERGVAASVAHALVENYDPELIQTQIEVFDWLQVRKNKRQAENPGGFLADSIRKNYVVPKSFVSRTELRRLNAEQEARRQAAEEAHRKALEVEKTEEEVQARRALDYLATLSPADFDLFQAEALKKGNAFLTRKYRLAMAQPDLERSAEYLRLIVEGYALKLLDALSPQAT